MVSQGAAQCPVRLLAFFVPHYVDRGQTEVECRTPKLTPIFSGISLMYGEIVMRKYLYLFSILFALSFMTSNTAFAVKYGSLDGEEHPYVGLMFAHDGVYGWRCSGTLVSPTVFVTAGHCTEGAVFATVYFDSDAEYLKSENVWVGGSTGLPFTHPSYIPQAFFVFDAGVVVLDEPYDLSEYAALPEADELDAMKTRRGKQDTTFTAVGYGLQWINPVFVQSDWVRMSATPRLIQINVPGFTGDFSMLLSNNHSTGGTCYGDSGGPNFIGDSNVIGGVTSYGINSNCAGTGGVYRLDKQHNLDFINSFLQ